MVQSLNLCSCCVSENYMRIYIQTIHINFYDFWIHSGRLSELKQIYQNGSAFLNEMSFEEWCLWSFNVGCIRIIYGTCYKLSGPRGKLDIKNSFESKTHDSSKLLSPPGYSLYLVTHRQNNITDVLWIWISKDSHLEKVLNHIQHIPDIFWIFLELLFSLALLISESIWNYC